MRDCSLEAKYDEDGVQATSGLNSRGQEVPDPVPLAPPVGYSTGPSFADFVRRTIRQELSSVAVDHGFESFEEAEDFDIVDDPLDPHTPYEAVFDPPPKAEPPAVPASDPPAVPAGPGSPAAASSSLPAGAAPGKEASPAGAPIPPQAPPAAAGGA